MVSRVLLAVLVLAAVVPAAASARPTPRLQALEDRVPTSTAFADRVVRTTRGATAAAEPQTYRTADGTPVRIAVSDALAGDRALAQSYADFVGDLPHGSELARLRMLIVPAADVPAACGAPAEALLACYLVGRRRLMIVPGDRQQTGGVTTSFIVAHEYGHHVAAFRSNAPFRALDWGPKRWASHELVCAWTAAGRLAPGDEGERYASNPGEAWAETYAHLTYPGVRWQFTELLAPTPASLAAARADVLRPWRGPVTHTLRGRFRRGGSDARRFRLRLRLDGEVGVRLRGPRGTDYDLRLASAGRTLRRSARPGSRDRVVVRPACRTGPTALATVTVLRRSGHGPFRATLRYPG